MKTKSSNVLQVVLTLGLSALMIVMISDLSYSRKKGTGKISFKGKTIKINYAKHKKAKVKCKKCHTKHKCKKYHRKKCGTCHGVKKKIEKHESNSVQKSPSSQARPSGTGLATQPVAGSQLSAVQSLPSSQVGGSVPTQIPDTQKSRVVQASASSQTGAGPGMQLPASQVSAPLQKSPSSHSPASTQPLQLSKS